jgi:hypothetical protein
MMKGQRPNFTMQNARAMTLLPNDTIATILTRIENVEECDRWLLSLSRRGGEIFLYGDDISVASKIEIDTPLPQGDIHMVWEERIAFIVVGADIAVQKYSSKILSGEHAR